MERRRKQMSDPSKGPGRRRPTKNVYTTKSGNTIKLNRSLGERVRANKEARARKRAAYLSTLPKERWKRILYRLHPKRVAKYWFSREGAIMALKLTGVGIVVCFLLLVGIFAYFRKDLPNIKDISGSEKAGTMSFYDRTGQTLLWEDYDAVKREQVTSDKISKYVKNATIAIEDKNFYKHGAFDVSGIMRAAFNDVFKGGGTQGGSTITQQLVKLDQEWTNDRTIARKFKELILAVEVEREYSKDDILTGYLNIAPYGNIQYGVETASQDYFGKSAKDLNLAEGAMLAAIPKAPSVYSPYGAAYDQEELIGRQQYIIDQMLKQRMVTKAEAEEAKAYDIIGNLKPYIQKYDNIKAPHFVLAAKQELEKRFGDETVKRGGWKVITTLDLRLQESAEKQVQKGIAQVRRQGGDTAAFAAVDVKTGQMVALVGGPDFKDPQYGEVNYAREWIPPGSSFKPYDYAALINEGENVGAGSVLYDNQEKLPGWPCEDKSRPEKNKDNSKKCLWDYDFRFPGPVTIRYALGGSRNVPAVKAMLTVGTNKTIALAESMGLTSGYKCFGDEFKQVEVPCYGSAAIGDGAYLHLDEHVNALATLSRMGEALPQTYILKIQDAGGKTLTEFKKPKGKQILKPDSAYIINDILADPNASYLRKDRKFHNYKGWRFAIKTGTTNDAKDGLMVSYSAQYASAVWVGSNIPKPMTGSMENMTQPIVQGWMQEAHSPLKAENWVKPSGIQTLPAYIIRGKISPNAEVVPSPANDLYPAWYKKPAGQTGASQVIDKVSGKPATSCTPDLAKETQGGGNDNAFSVDIFTGKKPGSGSTSAGQDDVHKCGDAKPQVSMNSPATCASSCSFTVTVTQGTHALTSDRFAGSIELYVNGQKVEAKPAATSPTTVTFAYTPTANGSVTVEARAIDSVLYTGSYSAQVNMVAGSSASPPGNPGGPGGGQNGPGGQNDD